MAKEFSSKISGTGSFLPQNIVGNQDLGNIFGLSANQIYRVTGIKTRRWAKPTEDCSMLGAHAARQALETAGIQASSIDVIIVSTTSPDTIFPSTSCILQHRLGIRRVPAFDISASCSGFLYGLSLADTFIKTGQYSNCLVVASEVKSRYLHVKEKESHLLFGDGASAAVVVRNESTLIPKTGILAMRLYSDGFYHNLVSVPAGGSRLPTTRKTLEEGQHVLHVSGGNLFRIAVKRLSGAIQELLKEFHLSTDDISQFIAHQANGRILSAIGKQLGLPSAKMISVIEDSGNTSSASLGMALDFAFRQGKLKEGEIAILGAFGGGITWGVALIRW